MELPSINQMTSTPLGSAVLVGALVSVYLMLLSINSHLPSVLLLSGGIAYLFYNVQNRCPVPLTPVKNN